MFLIGLVVVLFDQYTKHLVRKNIPFGTSWNPIPWLRPIVTLTHTSNTGVAFGLFPDKGVFFVGVAFIVVIGIVLYYRRLSSSSLLLRIALGLQLGGAIGNLIDRVSRGGQVTDFVDFYFFAVFNIADSSIVVGALLLAIYVLFLDRQAAGEALVQSKDSGTEPENA